MRHRKYLVVSQKPHTDWEKVHFASYFLNRAEDFARNYDGNEEDVYVKTVWTTKGVYEEDSKAREEILDKHSEL